MTELRQQKDGTMKYKGIVFTISVKNKEGINDVLEHVIMYAKDNLDEYTLYDSEIDRGVYACEVVREKAFYLTRQEVPFSLTTQLVHFSEVDKSWKAHVDICVPHLAHKKIIIGKCGNMIKRIGSWAREELIRHWTVNGQLFLNVRIR